MEVSKKVIKQKGAPDIKEAEIKIGRAGGPIRPGNRGRCCVRTAAIAKAWQDRK